MPSPFRAVTGKPRTRTTTSTAKSKRKSAAAILYQNGDRVFTGDLADSRQLSDLLARFYRFSKPNIHELEQAVKEFSERVPELARGLAEKIAAAHRSNKPFQSAFDTFFALCQLSLNPNIRQEAVDEMLIQHLLTERLFRTVFDNPEFTRRNAIALEVERVIDALVSHSFSRDAYLRGLDPFYAAIEGAARDITDFTAKQEFLNNIYERFFRGYSVKVADTHGIVYTPPEFVEYMCKTVENALRDEFGLSPIVASMAPDHAQEEVRSNIYVRAPGIAKADRGAIVVDSAKLTN